MKEVTFTILWVMTTVIFTPVKYIIYLSCGHCGPKYR